MYLGKFVCDNMPDFLATFRSRNLLFCLELSLLLQKAHHIRAVFAFPLNDRTQVRAFLKSTSKILGVTAPWCNLH